MFYIYNECGTATKLRSCMHLEREGVQCNERDPLHQNVFILYYFRDWYSYLPAVYAYSSSRKRENKRVESFFYFIHL